MATKTKLQTAGKLFDLFDDDVDWEKEEQRKTVMKEVYCSYKLVYRSTRGVVEFYSSVYFLV